MGTITNHKLADGTTRYKAAVSVHRIRDSKRFDTKLEAKRWILERESELSKNPNRIVKGKTTTDAFRRYAKEISPNKKGARWEKIRLKKLENSSLGDIPLEKLRITHAEDYITTLEESGLAPNSIIRELTVAKTVIRKAASHDWSWLADYPWKGLKMPKAGKSRNILITPMEVQQIVVFSGMEDEGIVTTHTQQVALAFLIAIETAMRLGEITQILRKDINFDKRTVYLPETITKTEEERTVPLSPYAIELMERLPKRTDGRLFGVDSTTASALFRRIKLRAGIKRNITFHDSRHLALTRLKDTFDVMELCRISGHKNPQQLLIYYNKSAEDMAAKMAEES